MCIEDLGEKLSVKQTAKILGVKVSTLSVWRCESRYPLPYVKIGRNVHYRKKDVLNFLESCRHDGTTASKGVKPDKWDEIGL
jgi:predicted DNA-binding transcriptional regulator AlpA